MPQLFHQLRDQQLSHGIQCDMKNQQIEYASQALTELQDRIDRISGNCFVSKDENYRFSDTRAIGWEEPVILSSFNIIRRAELTKSKRG
jgi:hypothetical protein